jgi:hypothetical protein
MCFFRVPHSYFTMKKEMKKHTFVTAAIYDKATAAEKR